MPCGLTTVSTILMNEQSVIFLRRKKYTFFRRKGVLLWGFGEGQGDLGSGLSPAWEKEQSGGVAFDAPVPSS